jgi:hypothetical protein
MQTRTPREIRKAAKLNMITVAVRAGVCEPTLRLYEANPSAVGDDKRRALDAVFAAMEASLAQPPAPAGT